MNRTNSLYIVLIFSFITALGFSLYFYNHVQEYDEKITDMKAFESPLPKYHIVLIGEEKDHDYWRLVGEGAKEAEVIYDTFVEYEGPKRSNPEEQQKLLDMAIQSNVDGIIVQALNENFKVLINEAVNKGIPVVTIDTDAPDSMRETYIGTDNYLAGQLAGEALLEDTSGEVNVGVVTGSFQNKHHQLRVEGFKDVIKKEDRVNVVAIEESNILRVESEDKAYQLLNDHKNITAFYGTSSYDGIGIVAAAKSLDRLEDLYVIGFDTLDENIELLKNEELNVVIGQQPFQMGYNSIGIILDIIKGKTVEDIYYTEVSILRKSDLTASNNKGGTDD
ncbi:sugar-binding protein [Salipaludibacillus agaradhaerens]|uniref:sugar-binding protein n=1 Tax=Salipaludibacillus agaradhaerens TaxID=76935 RepID=UPI002150EC1B|nr:sugar-binding protein [Salipaludibacillus agaradhaerens]MCR6105895.1 sugar-binding protein [Salipaludibacillus agaradhaerens]MCR6117928.1 sugar-binding protein [Salipaludibacillus agaradhaerens]